MESMNPDFTFKVTKNMLYGDSALRVGGRAKELEGKRGDRFIAHFHFNLHRAAGIWHVPGALVLAAAF